MTEVRFQQDVFVARAANACADGRMNEEKEEAEADAIVRTAVGSQLRMPRLDLEAIAHVKASREKAVDLERVDRAPLTGQDRRFVYGVACWIAELDGHGRGADRPWAPSASGSACPSVRARPSRRSPPWSPRCRTATARRATVRCACARSSRAAGRATRRTAKKVESAGENKADLPTVERGTPRAMPTSAPLATTPRRSRVPPLRARPADVPDDATRLPRQAFDPKTSRRPMRLEALLVSRHPALRLNPR